MKMQLLAISPGPLEDGWLRKLEQLLPLGERLGLLFRDTTSHARSYFEQAQQLAKLCRSAHVAFFVHRRLDMALALEAHLHLPGYGLSPPQIRPHLPPRQMISVAVHNEAEAQKARGANFALLSPVFSPGSKPEDTRSTLGPAGFGRLAQQLPCPAWALGGMDPETLQALQGQLKSVSSPPPAVPPPLAGVAVVSALWKAPKPLEVAQALLAQL
ncbi:MAG: thiamine phosphate synthase [Cystobacterineae bacterium]|nr:thiamine phosphate synthase [Cystobacterineae bacterium]